MKLTFKDTSAPLTKTAVLAVFTPEGRKPALPPKVLVPAKVLKDAKTDFRATRLVDASGPCPRVLLVGLGKSGELDADKLRRAVGLALRRAEGDGAASACLWLPEGLTGAAGGAENLGRAAAEAAVMATYRHDRFKSKSTAATLKSAVLAGPGARFRKGARLGRIAGEANCFGRDLQNAPGNKMRPRDMAAEARKLAASSPRLVCRVLDAKAMKQMGMGALLGVSAGSVELPRLIHLTYRPKAKAKKKVALVGKGLTFDSGGISIKPSRSMWEMKYDMSGGAAVLGVFHALANMDLPLEVHGIVPSSENMPDAAAVKPGDVVTAMDGTTIEVLNTDAEGRLILCDALAYTVKKVKPDTIVDLATLTGAVVVALGHDYTGLFASTDRLRDALLAAGDDAGERAWALPLTAVHKDWMKGTTADLRNINSPDQGAGSTAGAAFLAHFVGETEWAHLDIAGAAWGGPDRDYVGGNTGSGVGVRHLLRFLESGG